MSKNWLIASLSFLGGIAGNLVSGWIQQDVLHDQFTWSGILVTIIGVALILALIAWLEAGRPNSGWFHSFISSLKNIERRYVAIALIFLTVGYVIGAQVLRKAAIQTPMTPGHILPESPPQAVEPEIYIEDLSGWVVPFSHSFPEDWTWPLGTHEYSLNMDCSGNARDINIAEKFEVSEDAELISGEVYLRTSGIYQRRLGGIETELIDAIHPSQSAIALISLVRLTEAEAGILARECKGKFILDDLEPISLVAGVPYTTSEMPLP